MRVDRWNGNTLRRYHHPSRAIIIVQSNRRASVIPASMPVGVTVEIARSRAAEMIMDARRREQIEQTLAELRGKARIPLAVWVPEGQRQLYGDSLFGLPVVERNVSQWMVEHTA